MKKILDTIVRPEEVDTVVKAATSAAMKASNRTKRWLWSSKEARSLVSMSEAEFRQLDRRGLSKTLYTEKQIVPLSDGRVRVYLYASAFHVRGDGFASIKPFFTSPGKFVVRK